MTADFCKQTLVGGDAPADPVEVAEILFFASLLLRIVDRASSHGPTVTS
ncbi:MAG TPA: hypothetical protein VEM60_03025 [Candidatus Dormibacteraeota bacterium]|nr:hypothetical protein [Candidatus Dormibacteraeota bacterium]